MTTPSYASAYERMTSGCTTHVAKSMLSHPQLPPITPDSHVLDLACGPGIVTSLIATTLPSAHIDISPGMLAALHVKATSHVWSNITTHELDIRDLSPAVAPGSATHIFANLAGPVPGDPAGLDKLAAECFRALAPRGVAVLSTWADRVWPAVLQRAAGRIRPGEEVPNPFALDPANLRAGPLLGALDRAGFAPNLEVRSVRTWASAGSVEELVGNMWLGFERVFEGWTEREREAVQRALEEEMVGCRTFERVEGEVRIGMKAWVAWAWKEWDCEGEGNILV